MEMIEILIWQYLLSTIIGYILIIGKKQNIIIYNYCYHSLNLVNIQYIKYEDNVFFSIHIIDEILLDSSPSKFKSLHKKIIIIIL